MTVRRADVARPAAVRATDAPGNSDVRVGYLADSTAPGASLVLRDRSGAPVNIPVHLSSFSTDLNLQMASVQIQNGVSHRPIRVQEMVLSFSVEWPLRQYGDMVHLSEAIRDHYFYSIGVGQPQPMQFHYPGIGRVYYGFIQAAPRGDTRYTIKYMQNFRMRLVNASQVAPSSLPGSAAAEPYIPTPKDVSSYGSGWYDFTVTAASAAAASLAKALDTTRVGRAG